MRSELRAEANSQQGPFRPKARDILLSWTRAREYREGRSSRKIQSLGVGSGFKILHDRIITPGDGLIIFQGMQDATAESIKSLEGFRIAWVEEALLLRLRSGKGSSAFADWSDWYISQRSSTSGRP
jgi:hypothetical protein